MAKYFGTIILMTELEVMLIYKYLAFSFPLFSQEIWCTDSEKIDIHEHGKKLFIAFMLLNQ